jgi:flagellar basal-body rod protein FlgB
MLSKIDTELAFVRSALNLRARRQETLASNIANSDTPNYKARDLDFASALKTAMSASSPASGGVRMARTDSRHLSPANGSADAGARYMKYRTAVQPSLDGNTVDVDVERAHFSDNAMHYQFMLDRAQGQFRDMAMAIQPVNK